jgi:hypothetical protein
MYEDEEPFSTDSDEDTHNADDEPSIDHYRRDCLHRVRRYLETEHWNDEDWNALQTEYRRQWYRYFSRQLQIRHRRSFIIPFDGDDTSTMRFALYPQDGIPTNTLDRTIRRHRVQNGILQLEVFRTVQTSCDPVPVYTNDVQLDPHDVILRRMDRRGFPADSHTGQQLLQTYAQSSRHGWLPMLQLLHLCPDLVMTYFLRARPMERSMDPDWRLWSICYDILRHQELFPSRERRWTYLQYAELPTTEDEDNMSTDSDDTLS